MTIAVLYRFISKGMRIVYIHNIRSTFHTKITFYSVEFEYLNNSCFK